MKKKIFHLEYALSLLVSKQLISESYITNHIYTRFIVIEDLLLQIELKKKELMSSPMD